MEASAWLAVAAHHVGLDVQHQQHVPLSDAVRDTTIMVGRWSDMSDHIDADIQVHLLDKADAFNPGALTLKLSNFIRLFATAWRVNPR